MKCIECGKEFRRALILIKLESEFIECKQCGSHYWLRPLENLTIRDSIRCIQKPEKFFGLVQINKSEYGMMRCPILATTNARVSKVYVSVGDFVEKGSRLMVFEEDGCIFELKSEFSGIIKSIYKLLHHPVRYGDDIALIE